MLKYTIDDVRKDKMAALCLSAAKWGMFANCNKIMRFKSEQSVISSLGLKKYLSYCPMCSYGTAVDCYLCNNVMGGHVRISGGEFGSSCMAGMYDFYIEASSAESKYKKAKALQRLFIRVWKHHRKGGGE